MEFHRGMQQARWCLSTPGEALLSYKILAALLAGCMLVPATWSIAAADPAARGNILFLRCSSCHDVSTSKSAKIGPNLYGVIGRKVASLDGYPYSTALKSQDFIWDEASLDHWLTNPNALVPGTIMAFAGIPEAADRQAIIAYLERQSAAKPQ
jgi:cytochrome c